VEKNTEKEDKLEEEVGGGAAMEEETGEGVDIEAKTEEEVGGENR